MSSLSLTLLGLLGAYPICWITNKILPLRLDPASEEKGCDIVDHGIESDAKLARIEDLSIYNKGFNIYKDNQLRQRNCENEATSERL